jgi:hypothetical protein
MEQIPHQKRVTLFLYCGMIFVNADFWEIPNEFKSNKALHAVVFHWPGFKLKKYKAA